MRSKTYPWKDLPLDQDLLPCIANIYRVSEQQFSLLSCTSVWIYCLIYTFRKLRRVRVQAAELASPIFPWILLDRWPNQSSWVLLFGAAFFGYFSVMERNVCEM